MIKNLIYSIIISGLINYGYSQTNETKPISLTDKLTVNRENLERRITFIDEKEGIKQLQKLVTETEYEESWIFDKKNNIWIEIGYNESGWRKDSLGTYNKVSLDTAYISKIIKKTENIIFYHIHPIKNYPENNSIDSSIAKITKKYGTKLLAYHMSAFPSTNDILTMIKIQEGYYKNNKNGCITHKIVSYLGVTEYKITRKAILSGNTNILYYDGILLSFYLYNKIISMENSKEKIEDISIKNIKEVLSKRNNDYIEINFYPMRSIQLIE